MASFPAWPRVLVIVLNWNGADDTLACLESLAAARPPDFDVLVVDNGSRESVVPAVPPAEDPAAVTATEFHPWVCIRC